MGQGRHTLRSISDPIYPAKSVRLELGDDILRTFHHCDIIGLQAIEFGEKNAK